MKLTKLLYKGAFFIFLVPLSLSAQEISIRRLELENEKFFLFYELKDTTRGRYYTVSLYSSRDNYLNPITRLQGDVGLEILPGSERKIEVNVKDEFGVNFEDKLAFELRAKVYIPFIRLDGLSKRYKRGKPYEIHWSGGRPQNVLNFDLFKGEEKVHSITGVGNSGKYNLVFPADTKPGANYRFRISDSKNKDEMVNTGTFVIARKFPLLYKILPALGIGAAAYLLLQPKPECEGCLDNFPGAPEN